MSTPISKPRLDSRSERNEQELCIGDFANSPSEVCSTVFCPSRKDDGDIWKSRELALASVFYTRDLPGYIDAKPIKSVDKATTCILPDIEILRVCEPLNEQLLVTMSEFSATPIDFTGIPVYNIT